MKVVLKTSIVLNLLLIVVCICFLSSEKKGASTQVSLLAPERESGTYVSNFVDSAFSVHGGANGAPFRWSQLESADYRLYIKNLRAIGCPEQTIRDIITADVDGLYKARRWELGQKLKNLENATLSTRLDSQTLLEAELQKLPAEEAAVLAALLGSPLTAPPGDIPAPAPPQRRQPAKQAVSLPLVFADVDLSALHLDSVAPVINSLRQRFNDQLSGLSQSDPAYLERWQQAQPEVDRMLMGMIGVNAFAEYELTARSRHTGAPH